MTRFNYRALDRIGRLVEGTMDAIDKKGAMQQLRHQGLIVVEMSVEERGAVIKAIEEFLEKLTSISNRDKGVFSQQLATMITAGISLNKALVIIAEQTQNKRFNKILKSIQSDVSQGISFSMSMERFPDVFSKLFVSMIRTGEAGGKLADILNRWAEFSERDDEIRSKIKSAMMYPIILTVISFFAVLFLLIFVLPTFIDIFKSAGMKLPFPTRVMFLISDLIRHHFIKVLVCGGGFVFSINYFRKTAVGRFAIDKIKLKLPIMGDLSLKLCMARFSRTLGVMLGARVSILEALTIVKDVVGNEVISRVLNDVEKSVKQGGTLSQPLADSGVFSPMVVNIIPIGEETGCIDVMLLKVADFYDREVEYMARNMSSILEPVMLVVMGVIVGFIALSLILPMYEMISVVRKGGV